jgi:CPSF A subunit region
MRQKAPLQPFLVSRDTLFRRWAKRCSTHPFNQTGFTCTDKLNEHQIFVRAFDSDERLVGVAFMDVGVYVTSLRTLKNLLLVGDAVKSVMFVAFQVR